MKYNELNSLVGQTYMIWVDPVSELTLTHLMNLAEKALEVAVPAEGMQEATVLITAQDNIYTGTTGDEMWGADLIRQMESKHDTQVTHMVTLLRSTGAEVRQGLDLPSYNFRKMLLDLNEKNAFTLLVLQGHESLRARTIGSTM